MNTELHLGEGAKSSCGKVFENDTKVLGQYGTKDLKFLSALVPDVLLPLKKWHKKLLLLH